MANRNFPSQKLFSFHIMPVMIDGSITIGATGAVSSFTGKGIASITRTSAGIYRITLQDAYASLLTMLAHPQAVNSTTPSAISDIELLAQAVNTVGGGTVDIMCVAATSSSVTTLVPADPANGSKIQFALMLNNSSVQ